MQRRQRLTGHFLGGLTLLASMAGYAQVPVDDAGDAYDYAPDPFASAPAPTEGASIENLGDDAIPLLAARDLEDLVGPVALYPDTLLAVVLPAAAYPLQIVQAARFLEAFEADPTLTPPPDWDEAVVALLNYPEVLELLNDDIDWTLRLGEAVIAQQADVLAAVQRFRDRAYVAGNLESDDRQSVVREGEIIEIAPAVESTIYVPVYKPETVVRRSVEPVYTYYPDPYPVYYYPYADGHAFRNGFFWGVTSAYALGWQHRRLRVIHHSFSGHPYYGYRYGRRWWYRRPTLVYHNDLYYRHYDRRPLVRNRFGDYWVPRRVRRAPRANTQVAVTNGSSVLTTRPGRTPVETRVRTRTGRPTMDGIERGLREQGARRRDVIRSSPPAAGSLPSERRSRTYTTRQPATPAPAYQRRTPDRSSVRAPVRAPKYSTRQQPATPPSRSTRSTPSRSRSSSTPPVSRSSTKTRHDRD